MAGSGSETTTMGVKESGYKLSSDAFGESPTSVLNDALIDTTDADAIAKAAYNTRLNEFLTGEGRCSGNPE
ncbi:MAG: phage protein [Candidatus Brocadiaceae bacterium]|nr:phage protein [Candidatus Brocadiaceae bacterium]